MITKIYVRYTLEYVRLLELARNEYRKVVQENNLLKCQILGLRQSRSNKTKTDKRKVYC